MTYNAAVKVLKSEMEFLGMDWLTLRDFLMSSPEAFSLKARQAFQIVDSEDT